MTTTTGVAVVMAAEAAVAVAAEAVVAAEAAVATETAEATETPASIMDEATEDGDRYTSDAGTGERKTDRYKQTDRQTDRQIHFRRRNR